MGGTITVQRLLYSSQFKPDSVVLIQGASSGLGYQLALKYAARGCPLVVSGRNEKQLQLLVKECKQMHGNSQVVYKVAEATDIRQCQELVDFTVQKYGRLDLLVLAAGIAAHAQFRDLKDMSIFQRVMDVNVMGYANLTKCALDPLRQSKGQIVVISSISGEIGLAMRTAYCASKSAVNNFFRALQIEEPEIRISLILPDSFTGSNFRNNSLV